MNDAPITFTNTNAFLRFDLFMSIPPVTVPRNAYFYIHFTYISCLVAEPEKDLRA